MAKRSAQARVFFPWERRRGAASFLGRARARLVLGGALFLLLVGVLHHREENAAAIRATRATLTDANLAVQAFRADHGGECPKVMNELVGRYAREAPLDAWGRPLRLTCPGRKDPQGFEVTSDGPDGLPWGLDRVE